LDFSRLKKNWENLARNDPLWAIVADHPETGHHWDFAEFFTTGVGAINGIADELVAHGVEVALGSAIDFGCGYGRLTQALADRFAEVIGVDCAESMLKGARQHNRHGDRVRYVHNECPDLQVFPDASFDLLMSLIVLQHMRQDYQAGYLREFVRVLRPGGVLYVQFATVPAKGYQPGVAPPERPDEAIIEIHGMPAPVARAALQGAGADILYEVADGWAGVEWESMHLAARRRR